MRSSIEELGDKQVLYLTTIGRKTGRRFEIEIWFVVVVGCFYLLAEKGETANWVRNIRRYPEVSVRIEDWQISATARVLDREADRELWAGSRGSPIVNMDGEMASRSKSLRFFRLKTV